MTFWLFKLKCSSKTITIMKKFTDRSLFVQFRRKPWWISNTSFLLGFRNLPRLPWKTNKCKPVFISDQCSRFDVPKSRQKRLVTIPNLTTLGFNSRLIVPQPPIGVYVIFVKTRFFIRSLFTESIMWDLLVLASVDRISRKMAQSGGTRRHLPELYGSTCL